MKRKCAECDKTFEASSYEVNRGRGICCSRKCSSIRANRLRREANGDLFDYNSLEKGYMYCPKCKQILLKSEFTPKKRYDKLTKIWTCKKCRSEYYRKHRRNNTISYLITSAKRRAKKKGIEFSITRDDISIPPRCPILGIKLKVSDKPHQDDNSPTLDRIDPGKGYVPNNVAVISGRANRIKSDGLAEEHIKVAAFMKENID